MPRRKPVNPRVQQRKVGGKLLPYYTAPAAGPCWLCGRSAYSSRWWGGRYWCYWHHPRSPYNWGNRRKFPRTLLYLRAEDERGVPMAHRYFGNSGVQPDVKGLPKAKIAKAERKVDAILGRKKVTRTRTRRRPRDRRYVR